MSAPDSSPMPFEDRRITNRDFQRLEEKVDNISSALVALVRFEERQVNETKRINDLETDVAVNKTKIETLEKLVNQWINRGIGAWAIAVIIWGFFKLYLEKRI